MKYYIVTYGCQMNKNDSERIAAVLEKLGMKKAKDKNSADFIVINTCSVRQTAEDRVFGEIQNLMRRRHPDPPNRRGRISREDFDASSKDDPRVTSASAEASADAKALADRSADRSFPRDSSGVALGMTKKPFIAVTGCMVGRDKDGAIKKKLTGADLFFRIDELLKLPSLISHLSSVAARFGNRQPSVVKDFTLNDKRTTKRAASFDKRLTINTCSSVSGDSYLSIYPKSEFAASRYLTIQTGCNEFCSYCVVPYARGREYNRPLREILDEAKKIIKECQCNTKSVKSVPKKSVVEITLLGQIVNSWIAPDPKNFSKNNPFIPFKKSVLSVSKKSAGDFAALLWELNQLPELKRFQFISPHPRHMSDETIKALALPKMANYLHLPVQSGDDEILRKMNRKYTAKDYLKSIKKIRKVKPNIELGTDIIVGFPGETEKQFQNTVKLCKKAKFNVAYIAMYSPRSGTSAYKNFPDDIPHEVKKRRWHTLNKLINHN